MNRSRQRSATMLVLLVLGLSLCQCGGGGGSSGPTAPSDFLLTFGGQISNATGRQTLREVEVLLDGRVIGRSSSNTSTFTLIWLVTARVGRGQHEFAVRLVQQSSSPTRYLVGGGVDGVDANGAKVVDVNFPQRNENFSTGDRVAWTFSF
jgi:hypothetical protein